MQMPAVTLDFYLDARNGARREAKEGRRESHKNIIAYHMHKTVSLGSMGVSWGGELHGSMPPGLPCFLSSDSHPVSTKFLSVRGFTGVGEAQRASQPSGCERGRAGQVLAD